jgi:DNA helicase-2/ATP-dependent DNA helicase PcrA
VTFSVRAAGELRLRLAALLGETKARGVTVATFHSVCARMLREHAELFGRTSAYTIYDQGDVRRLIDWLLSDAARTTIQAALGACGQPAASEVLQHIALAKSGLQDPDSYQHAARHPAAALISAVWRELDLELQRSNAFDFEDLVRCAVRLLAGQAHRLAFYRQRWPWLMVDEYQDTNEAQAALVSLLAGPDGNVCCVGDADQAIFAFRGAAPRNMLAFAERFPAHDTIVLGRNFRCRAEILQPAVRCVAHNQARTAKALIAMRGAGGRVKVAGFPSERQEAESIASMVAAALGAGMAPGDVLVLARTGFASEPVQRALAQAGIPHRVLGSLGLYERAEVCDALAYLALLANPADGQALRRAISAPRRGVGTATYSRLLAFARDAHHGDLVRACAHAEQIDGIRSGVREHIRLFGQNLEQVRSDHAAGRSLGHTVVTTMTMPGGLVAFYQQRRDRSPKAEERHDAERVLEDLRSLCRAASTLEQQHPHSATLTGFLEHAAGLHAQEIADQPDPRITVSTIHRAKGTEARLVALAACEEALLPSWRSLASPDPGALEEERRLFYVACTRAKDALLITWAAQRNRRPTGGPSPFLREAGLLDEHPLAA